MWPSFTLNRPLIWLGLLALATIAFLPLVVFRVAALALVALGALETWRQIRREHQHHRLTEQALELSQDSALITNADNRIVAVNLAFTRLTGYTLAEIGGLRPSVLSSERHDVAFHDRYWQTLQKTGRWEGEVWNRRKHAAPSPDWLRVKACHDSRGRVTHYVGLLSDISRHRVRQRDLRRINVEDPLTGLPNRRRLHDLLSSRLRHRRDGDELDLALIDIDGFKAINGGMGIDSGDHLLKQFAQRLAAQLAGGIVGRLGGDEFLVIRTTSVDAHDCWIASLRQHLSEPFEIDGTSLRLGLTVGSCRAPGDGNDAGLLIQRLEAALHSAKRHGRNHDRRFCPSLQTESAQQLSMLNELRQALAQGTELEVHYQTQHDLESGDLAGMEALLRWRHPEHGLLLPGSFIPLAERYGLMPALGNRVIGQVITQIACWHASQLPVVPVWVNVSALQLIHGDLGSTILAQLRASRVPAWSLGLELTESVMIDERAEGIFSRLDALRRHGIQIAIDDFGTGYSSMAYLKRLPVDKLKLDREFIRALPHDSADASITVAVLAMAQGLAVDVIAEGVETAEQRDFLKAHGCRYVQGFLYAGAVPASALEFRLKRLAATIGT